MIRFFVHRPKLGLLVSLIVVVAGVFGATQLRREAFPVVDFAQVQITTVYPGATPEDVEELVTQKIEDELREVDGLKEVRSTSAEGLSSVFVQIDLEEPDPSAVITELRRAIDRVTGFPAEVEERPQFTEIKTQNIPVLEVSLLGEMPELEMRSLLDRLERRIRRVDGVATINKVGYRDREFRIALNAAALRELHVAISDVVRAVQVHNVDLPSGRMKSSPNELNVRTRGELLSVGDIEKIVVRSNFSGGDIRIRDIAQVIDTFEEPDVRTRVNGQRSMMLVIMKQERADIIEVAQSIRTVVDEFREALPQGAALIVSNDESRRTAQRLDIVINNTWIGFILVVCSLLVFLNRRTAAIAAFSMPLVVMGTLAAMHALGLTFNLITMLAIIIALGMFVDNSIVVTENIYRFREEGLSLSDATWNGVKTIMWPVTATVLTTIAAFAPMLVTKGIMGKFIWGIPVVVSVSLLICLAESFILLPSRILVADVGVQEKKQSSWFQRLQQRFERALDVALRHKWKTIGLANLMLVLACVWAVLRMDFILFPPEGADIFAIKYEATAGASIEDTHAAITEFESLLAQLPQDELHSFVTRTGVQQLDISDPHARRAANVGMIVVYLTPENERSRTATEIVQQLRKDLVVTPPMVEIQVQELIAGPPVGRPITLTVLGQDIHMLEARARDIETHLQTIEGVTDIAANDDVGPQQLELTLHDGADAKYGVSVLDVAQALRAAYEGVVASTVTTYGDEIDLRVQLRQVDRGSIDGLNALQVRNAQGRLIPLGDVATAELSDGPKLRRHFDYLRAITVTADVDLSITTSAKVNAQLRKHYQGFAEQYPGYELFFGGEEQSTQESMQSLFAAMCIAVLCIYAILVTLFNSLSKPLLVMFSIPFGFIGTIVGFSLHAKPLGFFAMIGVIGLAGVVVNASIVMLSFIDELRKQGVPFAEALRKGASMRLRPVVLTTVTTVAALLPTAYGLGGWDPILVPMTMALAWGLLFGTTLTLFLVPCSYAALDALQRRICS